MTNQHNVERGETLGASISRHSIAERIVRINAASMHEYCEISNGVSINVRQNRTAGLFDLMILFVSESHYDGEAFCEDDISFRLRAAELLSVTNGTWLLKNKTLLSAEKTLSPLEKTLLSPDKTFSAANKISLSAKKTLSSPDKIFLPVEKTLSPANKTFLSAEKTLSSAKKIFLSAKKIFWSLNKIFWSAEKILSSPEKTFSVAKKIFFGDDKVLFVKDKVFSADDKVLSKGTTAAANQRFRAETRSPIWKLAD